MHTQIRVLALTLILLSCGPPTLQAPPLSPPLSPKEREAILTVQQAAVASDDLGEQIWPGFHVTEVPILIFRPGARSFLIMAPQDQVPDYAIPVAFEGLELPAWVFPSARVATSPRTPFSQDFPVGKLKAFLVRHDDSSTREGFYRLTVHERFHHYQSNAFKRGKPPETCRFPYEDLEHALLIRSEEKLLVQLLNEADEDRYVELLTSYFALRRARYATKGGQKAQGVETWEEATEGTARYVEEMYAIAGGYSDLTIAKRALANYFASFDPKSLQKWRYYRTGLAMALGLDKLVEEDWKLACVEGKCLFEYVLDSLSELLDQVSMTSLENHLRLATQESDTVRKKVSAYLGEEQKFLEGRKTQGAFQIALSLEGASHGYYSARGVTFALADCSRMVTGVSSYVDRGFGLEVRNRSVRMINRPGFTMLEFYHDLTGDIRIDGHSWDRTDGKFPFRESLEIKVPDFEIHLSGCGVWEVANGSVSLSLQGPPNSPKCP